MLVCDFQPVQQAFHSQFEIARALLESETLRAEDSPTAQASAAEHAASNFYLAHKHLVSRRNVTRYLACYLLSGLVWVCALAPYSISDDICETANKVICLWLHCSVCGVRV